MGKSHARAKVAARCSPGASVNDTHARRRVPGGGSSGLVEGSSSGAEWRQEVEAVAVAGPVLGGAQDRPRWARAPR